jgi:hypothetical protein
VRFNDAAQDGRCRGLCTVRDFELFNDAVDVIAHGIPADVEGAADLLIREAADQHMQDFEFASGKIGARHSFGEPGGYITREITPACAYCLNCVNYFGLPRTFQ